MHLEMIGIKWLIVDVQAFEQFSFPFEQSTKGAKG